MSRHLICSCESIQWLIAATKEQRETEDILVIVADDGRFPAPEGVAWIRISEFEPEPGVRYAFVVNMIWSQISEQMEEKLEEVLHERVYLRSDRPASLARQLAFTDGDWH